MSPILFIKQQRALCTVAFAWLTSCDAHGDSSLQAVIIMDKNADLENDEVHK